METSKSKGAKNHMIHVRLPENIHKKVRIRAAEMDESISASMEDINKLRTVAYGTAREIGKLRSAMKSTAFIEGLTSIALRQYEGDASDLKATAIAFLEHYGVNPWNWTL